MSPTPVVVTYCEGWDTEKRQPVRPLRRLTALGRHEAGAAYAVLLTVDGDPRALLHVDRGAGHLGLFGFDAVGRRALALAYQDFGDHLRLRSLSAWSHEADDEPEFGAAMSTTFEFKDGNRVRTWLDHRTGGRFESRATAPDAVTRIPAPEFGAWPVDGRMLRLSGPVEFSDAADPADEGAAPAEALWSAPGPAEPFALDSLFNRGTRVRDVQGETLEVLEPDAAGLLRLATGRVVAGDPFTTSLVGEHAREPFTVAVTPGEYPVETAEVRWDGQEWDMVAAARVRVSQAPTDTWEPALRPGQDERLLGPGQFYGFGVDSGLAAFMDAGAAEDLALLQSADPEGEAPETPGVVVFPSGMGDAAYPVWIGRDAEGAVTSFVAEMRLVGRGAEVLPPATVRSVRRVGGVAVLEADKGPAPVPFDSGALLSWVTGTVTQQSADRGGDSQEWMTTLRQRAAAYRAEELPPPLA